jgi:hypothetical protein
VTTLAVVVVEVMPVPMAAAAAVAAERRGVYLSFYLLRGERTDWF